MTEKKLGIFEKYLTAWVGLCIVFGIVLGRFFPSIAANLNGFQYAQISIPIAICLFFMIYPIMVQIDFRKVVAAGKTSKPVGITLFVNWVIAPFSMAFIAWFFMMNVWKHFLSAEMASQYMAGMILLGIAPCTAMVLVWSYLSKGNLGHTLVMVAINTLAMLVLYVPLAKLLLGVSNIIIPWGTMTFSVVAYVGLPLVLGYFSRRSLLKKKGIKWFENKFAPNLHYVSITALLITLIVLFSLQGEVILQQPLIIGMIAIPLFIQTMFLFGIGYGLSKKLKLSYEDAAPTAQIGASNHFEVAIAVTIMLFGIDSGATLATVVGVLIEVPVMLALVKMCMRTQHWFPQTGSAIQ